MTTAHDIDLREVLTDRISPASPDLLRRLLSTFIDVLMSAAANSLCGAGFGERSDARTDSRNGYRHRDFDTRARTLDVAIPNLRSGSYFPDLVARAPQACREGADLGCGEPLPARCLDPADGETCRFPRHHLLVEVAGVRHGQGSRRPGRGNPPPSTGRRSVPVRRRRRPRARARGARERPGGQRAHPGRGRSERRGLPRNPGNRSHLRRGRGRLAGVLPIAGRPR